MREIQIDPAASNDCLGFNYASQPSADATARAAENQPRFRLSSREPAATLLLRRLAGPLSVLGTLLLSLRTAGASLADLTGYCIIVGLLAERVLSPPTTRGAANGRLELRPSLLRVLLEWSALYLLLMLAAVVLPQRIPLTRNVPALWFATTLVALPCTHLLVARVIRWWQVRAPRNHRHIIIGATDVGLELAKRVEHDNASDDFLGFFDFRDRDRLPSTALTQLIGSCADVAEFVRSRGVHAIYIALPISQSPRIAALLDALRDTTASVYFVPDLLCFELIQPHCVEIHGIPALAICETPFNGIPGLRKRSMDLVLATLALPLVGPPMLAIALAIRMTSRGPALFKQRRYGLNGEQIFVYKFRTMTVCEDGGEVRQATRDDRRITPLGRWLRRSSLDELPQLLNVLGGSMSIVGPRPHAVAHNEQYRKLIRGYMIRHKVRPGITGWAQVNGLRGETDTLDKMRARVQYDLAYLSRWSLWLDLKIVLRTAWLMVRDERAY